MLTLKNWYIDEIAEGLLMAHGIVYNHEKLSDGDYIQTSIIKEIYRLDDERYVIETASGSLYVLEDREINLEQVAATKNYIERKGILFDKNIKKRVNLFNQSNDVKVAYRVATLDNARAWAEENLDNGDLYLVISGREGEKAFFKKDDEVYDIAIRLHVGTFQDSVLVTDFENGLVDFRFFPRNGIEPYHWSDGLENIYFHNVGKDTTFSPRNDECISLRTREITQIHCSQYRGEGLFSPDVVTGKCIMQKVK